MFVSVCVCECMCESVCECPCFRGNGKSQGSQEDLAVFGLCLELPTYPRAGRSESHFSPGKRHKETDLLHVETNTVVCGARGSDALLGRVWGEVARGWAVSSLGLRVDDKSAWWVTMPSLAKRTGNCSRKRSKMSWNLPGGQDLRNV